MRKGAQNENYNRKRRKVKKADEKYTRNEQSPRISSKVRFDVDKPRYDALNLGYFLRLEL